MWGEVFHLLFCLFTDKNGKGRPFSEAKFYKALRKEQRFSIYQSNKILRRAGYKYRELFSEPLDNDLRISSSVGDTPAFLLRTLRNPTGLRPSGFSSKSNKYKENTPAFSYYVIKSLLLWNLDKFMNWSFKYSEKDPIQFNQKYIAEYCDLVEYLTANDGRYTKVVHLPRGDPDISKTLRMTAVDPNWY